MFFHDPPRFRLLLVGGSQVGKSTFLKHAGFDSLDADRPTTGIQFSDQSLLVSLHPEESLAEDRDPLKLRRHVILTAYDSDRSRLGGSSLFHRTDSLTRIDAFGLVFSAEPHIDTFYNLLEQSTTFFQTATLASRYEPFIFFIETHCDLRDDRSRLKRRRIIEIELYSRFQSNFLFFQCDARHVQQCRSVIQQIATQCLHQPLRQGEDRTAAIRLVEVSSSHDEAGLVGMLRRLPSLANRTIRSLLSSEIVRALRGFLGLGAVGGVPQGGQASRSDLFDDYGDDWDEFV
jgi:hypothetical protein